MFTAWSEIKYLATKILSSQLRTYSGDRCGI